MKNKISIRRVPGNDTICTVKFELTFDASDKEALDRFARMLREMVPEEDRAQFVADFQEAAAKAGFEASAG